MNTAIELSNTVTEVVRLHKLAEDAGANAEEHRLAVGKRLREIRKMWPKSGPGSSAWVMFLGACGIEKRTANRYIKTFEESAGIRDIVSRNKQSKPFDLDAAKMSLRKKVASALDAWPVESMSAAAELLLELAGELESKGYVVGGKHYADAIVNATAIISTPKLPAHEETAAEAQEQPEPTPPKEADDTVDAEYEEQADGVEDENPTAGETKCRTCDPSLESELDARSSASYCAPHWRERVEKKVKATAATKAKATEDEPAKAEPAIGNGTVALL